MTALVMHGTYCAGGRRRIVYRVLDDSQKPVGTAVCWTASNTLYPWGLTIPAANVINFGFASRADMMRAVEGFVAAGQIGGRHV
jgi:hypothetical protein